MIFWKGIQRLNDLERMLEIFESDARVCISTILKDCTESESHFVKSQRVRGRFNCIRNTDIWDMVSVGE